MDVPFGFPHFMATRIVGDAAIEKPGDAREISPHQAECNHFLLQAIDRVKASNPPHTDEPEDVASDMYQPP